MIAEYDARSGALANRYIPGGDADETAFAYDSIGIRSWYLEDAQGSVVATSDALGNAAVINQYGPSGEPGVVSPGRNQGRIRYTGQSIIAEAGTASGDQILYDYRARIYAPRLGRFLQTDPICTVDDLNLYTYVGNDPINLTDPSGLLADTIKRNPKTSIAVGGVGVVAAGACFALGLCEVGAAVAGTVAVGRIAVGVLGRGGPTAAAESISLGTKQAARRALDGPMGVAANKFFRDSSKNAQDLKITNLSRGGKRFEFFYPARNSGYGKRYVQEVDGTGVRVREFKETIGQNGIIEFKQTPR